MTKKYFRQKGFTLIEVLVTMSIFIVLIFGATAMLSDIFTNQKQQLQSLSNIDQARAATFKFTNEIRDAVTGSDGAYPLNLATSSQIIFYSSFGSGNGIINRIRYYVSGNVLYRGVVSPAGSPLAYDLSSEKTSQVQASLANENFPVFSYYDGNYDGSGNALSQPININNVRFVKINLIVQNQISPGDTSVFSTSAGAAIRSVKNNLGN
jgi:prepilin-type N-terminal cleavage/methylation domain-containing protein